MQKRSPEQFRESRYLTEKWFSVFTLGHDNPGKRNWLDDGEIDQGIAQGYTEHSVEYYINDWRYRGKIVPDEGVDAAFGCSYTFGYGVGTCWPELVGVTNLGQNGASNDQIARLAISYCKTFNPTNIYVMWTFKERREHTEETGGLSKFKNLSKHALAVSPVMQRTASLSYEDKETRTEIFGTNEEYMETISTDLDLGRFFSLSEDRNGSRVTIIGYGLKEAFFGFENPIGKYIKIDNINILNLNIKGSISIILFY